VKRLYEHRLAITVIALAAFAVLMAVGPARDAIAFIAERAEPLIAARPVAGAVLFVILAVLSAMLSFVSSVALVPVAVGAWGPAIAALLLWAGWFIGGIGTYHVGRYLGQPVARRLVSARRLARYKRLISRQTPFLRALAVMITMPSDIAGYAFGVLGYPRRLFVPALAIAEVPYALVAAYLGDALLGARPWIALLIVAAVAAIIAGGRWRSLRQIRSRNRRRRMLIRRAASA
jgi:uncharacterized membrane protein YdjX (TVP38/TMEM64 family)